MRLSKCSWLFSLACLTFRPAAKRNYTSALPGCQGPPKDFSENWARWLRAPGGLFSSSYRNQAQTSTRAGNFGGRKRSLKFTPEVPAEPGPLAAEPGRAALRGPKTPKNRSREIEKGPRRGPPSVLICAVRVRSCLPSCPFSSSPDDLAACKSPVGWPSRRFRTLPPPRWGSSHCALR